MVINPATAVQVVGPNTRRMSLMFTAPAGAAVPPGSYSAGVDPNLTLGGGVTVSLSGSSPVEITRELDEVGLSGQRDTLAGALSRGLRTGDIMQPNMRKVGTSEMGKAILEEMERAAG